MLLNPDFCFSSCSFGLSSRRSLRTIRWVGSFFREDGSFSAFQLWTIPVVRLAQRLWLNMCGLSSFIIGCNFGLTILMKLNIKNLSKSVGLFAVIRVRECLNYSWYSSTIPVCDNLLTSSIKSFHDGPPNIQQSSSTK